VPAGVVMRPVKPGRSIVGQVPAMRVIFSYHENFLPETNSKVSANRSERGGEGGAIGVAFISVRIPLERLTMTDMASSTDRAKRRRDVLFSLLSGLPFATWAPLPLRLIVGYGFMEHGFAKLARGADSFIGILHTIGVPEAYFMGWATIMIELVGGFAILAGAFVPVVSVPMAVVLMVAMFTVHLPYGFSSIKLLAVTSAGAQFGPPGYETDLLYLAAIVALVLAGPGPFAIDGLIRTRMAGTRRQHSRYAAD
jgi:putative oxidoreductase